MRRRKSVYVIINSFAQFLPHVFVLTVVGLVWDFVICAFRGWLK